MSAESREQRALIDFELRMAQRFALGLFQGTSDTASRRNVLCNYARWHGYRCIDDADGWETLHCRVERVYGVDLHPSTERE